MAEFNTENPRDGSSTAPKTEKRLIRLVPAAPLPLRYVDTSSSNRPCPRMCLKPISRWTCRPTRVGECPMPGCKLHRRPHQAYPCQVLSVIRAQRERSVARSHAI